MKDAIFDFISEVILGNIEPTFSSEEAYDWWEGLNDSYFESRENGRGETNIELKDEKKTPFPLFEEYRVDINEL